jgi:hypothetical protein
LRQAVEFFYTFVEMNHETQISAWISESTKLEVERYADAHGVKKGHLVEEALLHHLQALRALPIDLVIPPRLVLTAASLRRVDARLKNPGKPTRAMRALMAGKRVAGAP